ncbi:hypothetical protein PQX77_013523 [Marasmius sp. AFHP31]|nr:hypothetical protein PQX77_013523 [Marasmius sp. AFHP31]
MSSNTTSNTTSTISSAVSASASTVGQHDYSRSLLAAGLTLGILGAIAIAIIVRWTYHLKVPNGPTTLKDMEEGDAMDKPSKHKRRGPSISGAVALGGGLVRKATGKLLHSGSSPSDSRRQLAAKITPFGSSTNEEGDGPKFVHIPGQNMRIATRTANGGWTFSEPDARTNRRSMSAASWFGITGGNGRTSAYGLGGYNGIDAASVQQVSPTKSSSYHQKPRYQGGDSSLSVNTYGLSRNGYEKDDYAYSSAGGHSPIGREARDEVGLLPTVSSDRRLHPRLSIPMSAYSPSTSPTTSSYAHAPSVPPFTLSSMSPPLLDSPLYGDFPSSVDSHSHGHSYGNQNHGSKPFLNEIQVSNPFESPILPSPTAQHPPPLPPKTPRSRSFNFLDHTQGNEKEKEKEKEAYGFERMEGYQDVEAPPPAYDREKERQRERERERKR